MSAKLLLGKEVSAHIKQNLSEKIIDLRKTLRSKDDLETVLNDINEGYSKLIEVADGFEKYHYIFIGKLTDPEIKPLLDKIIF